MGLPQSRCQCEDDDLPLMFRQLAEKRVCLLHGDRPFPSWAFLEQLYLRRLVDPWQPSAGSEGVYEGRDRKTKEVKWNRHACRPNLWFALAAAHPCGSLCVRGLE